MIMKPPPVNGFTICVRPNRNRSHIRGLIASLIRESLASFQDAASRSNRKRMEVTMNREQNDDLIDLGAVTEETKGVGEILTDGVGGQLPRAGLSDD